MTYKMRRELRYNLWEWQKQMCQKASEGVTSNKTSKSTCRLKTGEFIHRGITCDGCRYDNPLNVY